MRGTTIAVIIFAVILILGGLVVLTQAPLSPKTEKVEQVLPDDRIPR